MELERFSEEQLEKFLISLNTMKEFNHPNIAKVYEYFQDSSRIYIILEHIDGIELFDHIISIKQISEKIAAKLIKQVLSAI